jgi:hypothetical protein
MKLVVLDALEYKYLLDFVKLYYAVHFPFIVIFEGVEVGGKGYFVEKEINLLGRKSLLLHFALKDRLKKGPKDYFVYYTIYSSCFLLIFKQPYLAHIHAEPKISSIQNSDSTKVARLNIGFDD